MSGPTIRTYPGWRGAFTRERVHGALANDTRVEKVMTEKGDAHPIGARATVVGSIKHPELGIAYFVEWDTHPKCAVLTVAKKVRPVSDTPR